MFKKIALVVVALAGALLAYAATRPDSMHVQRAASIKAPPEKIFPLINDFHSWSSWSPYEKLDPAMKRAYSGAADGKGAVYEWQGNSQVGQGRMEITDTSQPSRVTIKTGLHQAARGPRHRRVHAGTARRLHDCHVDDGRADPVRWEVDRCLCGDGYDDRRPVRDGPCQPEGPRRKVITPYWRS
jgi:polyketide cyclase/dehydrase/lipid transport protein